MEDLDKKTPDLIPENRDQRQPDREAVSQAYEAAVVNIEVEGDGYIGDKARQLMDKAETLRQIGFHIPPTTALSEEFLGRLLGKSLREIEITESTQSEVAALNFDKTEREREII